MNSRLQQGTNQNIVALKNMEIIILIGIGWFLYYLLKKNSNQDSNIRDPNITVYTSINSTRRRSSRNTNTHGEKESNAKLIRRAIDSGSDLTFRYIDQDGEITVRTVTPEYMERRHENEVLCLVAHCHLRGASRTFVIRKMQNITIN
jgi:hypothetical protein